METGKSAVVSILCAVTAVLGLGALAGCGDDGLVHADEVATVADFVAASIRLDCARQIRCGEVGASEGEACRQRALKFPTVPDLVTEVQAGRLVYDANAGAACLNARAAASCGDLYWATIGDACQVAFTGAVAPGKSCYLDSECAGGYCTVAADGCAGQCVAWVGLGADCTTARCDRRLTFCDSNHTCAARGLIGAACGALEECRPELVCLLSGNGAKGICGVPRSAGQPCRTEGECGTNLYCSGTEAGCQPLVAAGGACTYHTDCLDNLGCAGVTPGGGNAGKCAAWGDIGKPCTVDASARSSGCPYSQRCDSKSGTCVAIELGDNCAETALSCGFSGICSQATRTCVEAIPYGGACTPGASGQCEWGSCDANTGKCAAQCK